MGVKSRFIYSLSLSPLYNRKKVGLLTHFHSRRDMNVKSQVTYSPSLLTTVYTCPCLCASFYIAVRVLHHCTGLISLYSFFYIAVQVLHRCTGFISLCRFFTLNFVFMLCTVTTTSATANTAATNNSCFYYS